MYNNVPALGHAHPKVAEAVYQQMRMLNVHTRYLHEGIHRYIERLLATLPASLDRLVMTCTGSESNRITSYNVCYTKLLRSGRLDAQGPRLP